MILLACLCITCMQCLWIPWDWICFQHGCETKPRSSSGREVSALKFDISPSLVWFLRQVLMYPDWLQSHYVAKDGLESWLLLPLPRLELHAYALPLNTFKTLAFLWPVFIFFWRFWGGHGLLTLVDELIPGPGRGGTGLLSQHSGDWGKRIKSWRPASDILEPVFG